MPKNIPHEAQNLLERKSNESELWPFGYRAKMALLNRDADCDRESVQRERERERERELYLAFCAHIFLGKKGEYF